MLFKLWFDFVKANLFDEKISAKLKGSKEMHINSYGSFSKFTKNKIKCGFSCYYSWVVFLLNNDEWILVNTKKRYPWRNNDDVIAKMATSLSKLCRYCWKMKKKIIW